MRISMHQITDHIRSKNNPHKVRRGQAGEPYKTLLTVTTAHTVTADDEVILGDASGGAFTVTLPTAVDIPGRAYWIKKTDSSANAVTIDGDGAETIDGSASKVLTSQYDAIMLISDGVEWGII